MTKNKNKIALKNLIYKMLKENTGIAMCDSGGENGRMWQRNAVKSRKDFDNEPEVTYDHDFGGSYTISTYHHLVKGLELDDLCKAFNRRFVPAKNWDSEDFYGVSAKGTAWIIDEMGFKVEATFNTYNEDSNLSQILQGAWLELGDRNYVLLQIHGGADARGGYTDARLFYVPEKWNGALMEDVDGTITKADGAEIQVTSSYSGSRLTTEDGQDVDIKEGDSVQLYTHEL